MNKYESPLELPTIASMHQLLSLPKPAHPLVSVVRLTEVTCDHSIVGRNMMYGFFDIALKKNFDVRLRYGRSHYDFDEGVMTFFAPKQIFGVESESVQPMEGYMLLVHPDFLKGHALAQELPAYGYFSYSVNEALHLSESEEKLVNGIMENLDEEIRARPDSFSHELILSQISLLLQYCNRFYNRQFLTRKPQATDSLARFEQLLNAYFESDLPRENGLPTVQYFSDQLHLSPDYLSDLLRNLTGRNARQHIQDAVVEKAKQLLSATNMSVSEVAFAVGFEHSQSFSKLFRTRVALTPGEYRMSFN